MMNVHGVAATLAVGSVLALLADKPAWAVVYVIITTPIEVKALTHLASQERASANLQQAPGTRCPDF